MLPASQIIRIAFTKLYLQHNTANSRRKKEILDKGAQLLLEKEKIEGKVKML